VGVLEVVGNHGIEPRFAANRYAVLVKRWHAALAARCQELPGVWLEDKVYSLAVHYRKAADQALTRAAIRSAVATLEASADADDDKPRVVDGKCVINLLPPGAVDKGVALLRECERLSCVAALYVGDDETDEAVFARAEPGRILGVRVGARDDSAASLFLPNQAAVDELLRMLIDLRPETQQGRRRDHALTRQA
jgi:trehalose 6-phosphate phosphatase